MEAKQSTEQDSATQHCTKQDKTRQGKKRHERVRKDTTALIQRVWRDSRKTAPYYINLNSQTQSDKVERIIMMSAIWPSGRSGQLRSGGKRSSGVAHTITIYFKYNIRYVHYRRSSYWRLQNITYEFLHMIHFLQLSHLILFYTIIIRNSLISWLKVSTVCLTFTCAIN